MIFNLKGILVLIGDTLKILREYANDEILKILREYANDEML